MGLLGADASTEIIEEEEKVEGKNRKNPRH